MEPKHEFRFKIGNKLRTILQRRRLFSCLRTQIEPYQCVSCKNFRTHFLTSLKQHYREGHAQQKFIEPVQKKCTNCHLTTYSKYLLLRHTFFDECEIKVESSAPKVDSVEDGYTWFCCLYCSYKSTSQYHLVSHVSREHTSVTKEHKCKYCTFETFSSQRLENHTKSAHGNRTNANSNHRDSRHEVSDIHNLEVQIISSATESEVEDKVEIKRKTRRKTFRCPYCTHKNRTKGWLGVHIKRYHPEKTWSYSCRTCEFKCATKVELMQHYKEHREKEKHSVEICNLESDTSVERNDLQCELCLLIAETRSELLTHVKRQHFSDVGEWFKCEKCAFETLEKSMLQSHTLGEHG